jgi:hypothetical protein
MCIGALVASGVLSSVALFILVGLIPGTTYMLSPGVMLGLLAGCIVAVFNKSILRAFVAFHEQRHIQRLAKLRAHLPYRRYIRHSSIHS